jgi:hypothetical protein
MVRAHPARLNTLHRQMPGADSRRQPPSREARSANIPRPGLLASRAHLPHPAAGKLRLKVAWDPAKNAWACAEVLLDRSLGYGTYNWKLSHDHSKTTEYLAGGLFLYAERERLSLCLLAQAGWVGTALSVLGAAALDAPQLLPPGSGSVGPARLPSQQH